ncbi:MAG: hypothetical protein HYZ75_12375 [Elusimicrobia bacterium]|nr:hypothetical protein [Elusimicrobiota bacterium]
MHPFRPRPLLLLGALSLLLTALPALAEDPPPQAAPPTPVRREDPLAPFLSRLELPDPDEAQRAGFDRDLAAFLESEGSRAAVDHLAVEVGGFSTRNLSAVQARKLDLLTRILDLQAADQDRRFEGVRAGARFLPPGRRSAPPAGPAPEDWADRLAPAPARPKAGAALASALRPETARPDSTVPRVSVPVRGFSDAPPAPGSTGRLPQLYTPPGPRPLLGMHLPPELSGEFNPRRLPPMNRGETYPQYFDRLPLAALQAYSHWSRGQLDDIARQGRERRPAGDLLLAAGGGPSSDLAQKRAVARWLDGHLDSAVDRRRAAIMPVVASIEGGQAPTPRTLARLGTAQLTDLVHVLDARAALRPPTALAIPEAAARADQTRGVLWRALLDRAVPADPRLGAPSSWLGLSDDEFRRRLAGVGDPARAAMDAWTRLQAAQDTLPGIGPHDSRDGRRLYYGLQAQVDRIVAGQSQPAVLALEDRSRSLLTEAYARVGGDRYQAGINDLRGLRAEALTALRDMPPADGLPLVAAQRDQLEGLIRRIDGSQRFLARVPPLANVPYTGGPALPAIQQIIGPGAEILGGNVYRISDHGSGAMGTPHQHLMLDVRYRGADGREQTASWPFGFFQNAATERDTWVARNPNVTAETLRTLRPEQVFGTYANLVDTQQRSNTLFQTGQLNWTLTGVGNNLGGWEYTGLPVVAALLVGGGKYAAGQGVSVNCRDVACIFEGRLPKP